MIVDWTDEFDRRLTNAEEQVGKLPAVAVALLQALNDLPAKPDEESLTSSESGRPDAMSRDRLPPHDPDVAVRIICWFPANDQIVLVLVGFDKKSIGDVFHASAAARGEAIVDAWLRQKGSSHD